MHFLCGGAKNDQDNFLSCFQNEYVQYYSMSSIKKNRAALVSSFVVEKSICVYMDSRSKEKCRALSKHTSITANY